MFINAKAGDKVWDFPKGWGTIIQICDGCYPIEVQFETGEIGVFTFEGKCSYSDLYPSLFWDEIKFEIPKKPFNLEEELKKLEIIEFKKQETNYSLEWNNGENKIEYDEKYYCQQPLGIYFTSKSIYKFMINIKGKKITKEEFFTAYKNVFGEKIK